MSTLVTISHDDPREVRDAVRTALDGGAPIGLGMLGSEPAEGPEGTAVVIATSGSSGIPKRVMLSAEALRASVTATAERIGQGRWMLALPAGYVAGLQVLVRSLLAGTDPVLLGERFSASSFVEATRLHTGDEPLFTSLVPAQVSTLLDAADTPGVAAALRRYQAILVGGQALPVPLRERAADAGMRLVRTYGSSETSGGCVYDGIPLDGVTVRDIGGELCISGPTLATGYLGDDELTARSFVRDAQGIRWYRTGDAGILDDGVVQVSGRIDNVIVSGGVNISLDRVERIVRGIPGLDRAVVVGVPDARWGETPVIVAPRGSVLQGADHLRQARDAVAAAIGAPARPTRLMLVDELAALASGKPDRAAITRLAADLNRGQHDDR